MSPSGRRFGTPLDLDHLPSVEIVVPQDPCFRHAVEIGIGPGGVGTADGRDARLGVVEDMMTTVGRAFRDVSGNAETALRADLLRTHGFSFSVLNELKKTPHENGALVFNSLMRPMH